MIKFLSIFFFLFIAAQPLLFSGARIYKSPVPMVAAVPVADVRAERTPHSGEYEYDPVQETQLLAGEPVLVFEKKDSWCRIEAPEQMEYTHFSRWQGYPGWVACKTLTSDLSRHHRLIKPNLPEAELRERILESALRHLGHPYLWGGRSLHDPGNKSTATGVDCSGLVNWSFRQVGLFIPRDAQEQSMRARPVMMGGDLKPADLIFIADEKSPEKITHVALYAGGEELVEAPQSGERVRRISFQERFGRDRAGLRGGENVKGKIVTFGALLEEIQ